MKFTPCVARALAWVALLGFVAPASAERLFIMEKTPTGGIQVTGSGSGITDRADGVTSSDWDIQDFITNFIADTATSTQTNADTVSGFFRNVTTDTTETITAFAIDYDGSPSADNDIDYDTENTLSFAFGDEMLFEVSATFEATTYPYSDLIPGTHIDVGRTQGAGIAEEAWGITTVVVVPEPTGLILAGALLGCAALRRSPAC